jgi:hypothetical protein
MALFQQGRLHWPNVPAVAEFRKLIEEAEKQQQDTKPWQNMELLHHRRIQRLSPFAQIRAFGSEMMESGKLCEGHANSAYRRRPTGCAWFCAFCRLAHRLTGRHR